MIRAVDMPINTDLIFLHLFFSLSFSFLLRMTQTILTLDNLADSLANDTKIKVAAVDIDGLLRGKIIHKEKFLQVAKSGFGKVAFF